MSPPEGENAPVTLKSDQQKGQNILPSSKPRPPRDRTFSSTPVPGAILADPQVQHLDCVAIVLPGLASSHRAEVQPEVRLGEVDLVSILKSLLNPFIYWLSPLLSSNSLTLVASVIVENGFVGNLNALI